MSYKTVPHEGKTVAQMNAERAAAKDEKTTDDDRAAMRAFGFTDAEALNSISRYEANASSEHISDPWDYSVSGVWHRAYSLADSLDPDRGEEIVVDAMNGASSPREFWTRLKASLTDEEE